MKKPLLIVIGGPTASGKTDIAIKVALALGTDIMNADSRQIYKELNIGVAKPSPEQLSLVKHHFVSEISLTQHYSAGDFASEARERLQKQFETHGLAIVSGGTGLYIQGILQGFDDLPEVEETLRLEVKTDYEKGGLKPLVAELLRNSPDAGSHVDFNNTARVIRAVELTRASGKTLSELRLANYSALDAEVLGYWVDLPRSELYMRINQRVDEMMKAGFETEGRNLLPNRHLKALKTVGYNEFFDYFDGKITLAECVEKIKQHTRNYAKRQMTWLRNQTNFKPVPAGLLIPTIFADLKEHGYTIHE